LKRSPDESVDKKGKGSAFSVQAEIIKEKRSIEEMLRKMW
jgi:hypothetical protein